MTKKNAENSEFIREHRRFIRHPMCFPLTYKIIDRDSPYKTESRSTTINIGVGGLLFSAKNPAAIDSKIVIKMPFKEKVFNIKAKVVHCEKSPEPHLYTVGVCFYGFTDALKAKLIEQLYLISEFRDLEMMRLGREVSFEEASRAWIKRYSRHFKKLYY